MSQSVKELLAIQGNKKVVTSIEYRTDQPDQVVSAVQDVLTNHLNEFSKITYDIVDENSVRVELTEKA